MKVRVHIMPLGIFALLTPTHQEYHYGDSANL